jgi:putative FmdB family regulatory protein
MIYEYRCEPCAHAFDVVKPVADMERDERCPRCEASARRQFVPSRVFFAGTSVQNAEYNPGLGCVVKNKAHREELARRRGLVEIGNDYQSPDSIHKKFDQAREEKREQVYEQAMREIV